MWSDTWLLFQVVWILLFLVGFGTSGDPSATTKPMVSPQTLRTQKEIEAAMVKSEIIPDLFLEAPKKLQAVLVEFEGNSTADLGNHLPLRDLKHQIIPFIQWRANETDYHTLMILNLDVPTREKPSQREWIVWLRVNIPGCRIMRGHQIIEYEVPNPEEGTGSHRYVALVYYQKQGKQKFREFGLNIVPGNLPQECIRQKFQSRFFAADYDLDGPTGINFWETQWEEII